jgi:hypothetical protein
MDQYSLDQDAAFEDAAFAEIESVLAGDYFQRRGTSSGEEVDWVRRLPPAQVLTAPTYAPQVPASGLPPPTAMAQEFLPDLAPTPAPADATENAAAPRTAATAEPKAKRPRGTPRRDTKHDPNDPLTPFRLATMALKQKRIDPATLPLVPNDFAQQEGIVPEGFMPLPARNRQMSPTDINVSEIDRGNYIYLDYRYVPKQKEEFWMETVHIPYTARLPVRPPKKKYESETKQWFLDLSRGEQMSLLIQWSDCLTRAAQAAYDVREQYFQNQDFINQYNTRDIMRIDCIINELVFMVNQYYDGVKRLRIQTPTNPMWMKHTILVLSLSTRANNALGKLVSYINNMDNLLPFFAPLFAVIQDNTCGFFPDGYAQHETACDNL